MNFFGQQEDEDPIAQLLAMNAPQTSSPLKPMDYVDPRAAGEMPITVPQAPKIQPKMRQPQAIPEPMPSAPTSQVPDVNEYIKNKYNLGKYSDAERDKLLEEQKGFDTTGAIAGALASLGAGFQGKDSVSAGMNVLNQRRQLDKDRLSEFDKGRDAKVQDIELKSKQEKEDPSSQASIAFRKMIEANFPKIAQTYGDSWQNVTAADQDRIFKPLELKEQMDMRRQQAAILAGTKQDAKDEKRNDRELQLAVPGYERTGEVLPKAEEAAKLRVAAANAEQLNSKLRRMKDLVKQYGSFEYGGEGGTEMESLATEIQLLSKSPEMYQLGVLTGPDLSLLQKIASDPSSASSLFSRDSSRQKQIDSQIKSISDKLSSVTKASGYRPKGELGQINGEMQEPQPVERRDPKTGKVALFDAQTKQFLGYK